MKAILMLMMALGAAVPAQAALPPRGGYVNDFAGMLRDADRTRLERELARFDDRTSVRLSVVTVPSLEGLTDEAYANGLISAWDDPQKEEVLLFVAPADHKIRIAFEQSLRPELAFPDAELILSKVVVPTYRRGHRAAAVLDGASALMTALGDVTYEKRIQKRRENEAAFMNMFLFVTASLGLILVAVGAYRPREGGMKERRIERDALLRSIRDTETTLHISRDNFLRRIGAVDGTVFENEKSLIGQWKTNVERRFREGLEALSDAESVATTDPIRAQVFLEDAETAVRQVNGYAEALISPNRQMCLVDAYRDAETVIAGIEELFHLLEKKGYRLAPLWPMVDPGELLAEAKHIVSEPVIDAESADRAFLAIARALNVARSQKLEWDRIVQIHEDVGDDLEIVAEVLPELEEASEKLDYSILSDAELEDEERAAATDAIKEAKALLVTARQLHVNATLFNSMERQEFDKAAESYDALKNTLTRIRVLLFGTPGNHFREVSAAVRAADSKPTTRLPSFPGNVRTKSA